MSSELFEPPPSDLRASEPDLPRPLRERWQPLRVGLVELFHYDSEEFWFRDGHLLLRGNNGTGKSKVLSLTLPFLFDASLSASRVEPDGDRGKRMEWNLLLGRHERRLGYTWAEFGRRDADGRDNFLTFGCGLHAVAGRGRVDPPWYFVTEQRVGPELQLISQERTALSRDRLESAVEGRGRVFDKAKDYRRAVDERLFRLGDRYDGLIDTLIQLRQPQLSKKPDEQTLSGALSNALPELPRAMIDDVADAMNQLDEYRDELAQIERLRGAISDFSRRYRAYAQIQARRQARHVRQAQSEFDQRSRELHEAEDQLARAEEGLQAERAHVHELDLALVRDRAALDELKSDPSMLDARRLDDLERAVRDAERELARAQQQQRACAQRLDREQSELARCEEELVTQQARCEARAGELDRDAAGAGLASDHARLVHGLIERSDLLREREHSRELERVMVQRAQQIARVREQLSACERAERLRDAADARCQDLRASFSAAAEDVRAADQSLQLRAAELVSAWRAYLADLRVLVVDEPESLLAELGEWVHSLAGDSPVLAPLEHARQRALTLLASEQTALRAQDERLLREDEALAAEEAALHAGGQLPPPQQPSRDYAARRDRPGAEFWRLVEFRPHVTPAQRAGIEAALEGAGLLDAWVTPEAHVLHPETRDAWLVPGTEREHSLFDWLEPGDSTVVTPVQLQALLSSIATGPQELDDGRADSWLSTTGRFRIGRLQGAQRKSDAQYLGHAAREASRQRRLAELAQQRAELSQQRERISAALVALQQRDRELAHEWKRSPRDEALRDAHARFSAAEAVRRQAQDRLALAEREREAAHRQLSVAREALQTDARDMRLPADEAALRAVDDALRSYRSLVASLWHAFDVRARAQADVERQIARQTQVANELAEQHQAVMRREHEHTQVRARYEELAAITGTAVAALKARMQATAERVREGERDLTKGREKLAEWDRAKAQGEVELRDRATRRQESEARRRAVVERFQGFAGTGLLGVAAPELEQPGRERWSIDPTLQLARKLEEQLSRVAAEDSDWARIQSAISNDFTSLGQALSALGHRASMETTDFGMVVQIIYGHRSERPDLLSSHLESEVAQRREILSAREREVLENHLQSEVAAHLQRLLHEAEQRVTRINAELQRRPTSTGVYFKLEWEPLPEGDGGAPVGLAAARTRLLRRVPDAWSADDRRILGEFLRARIDSERAHDDASPLIEHLARALDYRQWHRFRVKRWHDGGFRPLSGPASSGERALGLTVPLFAAASSYYESAESPHAPRLVLLDEAFAGIDDEARSHCMALIREFDLDFVMTSEREWGCYSTLPGVSICQIIRREGIDGVYVSRWSWDGHVKRREPDLARRSAASEGGAE